jgi:shikimate dehydrogenase
MMAESGETTNPMKISGGTRLVGIVGDPIAQVRSPEIFNPRLVKSGVDAVLVPLHVPAGWFDEAMRALMRVQNLAGLVVTIPFKERAVTLADGLGPIASKVGAINALRRAAGGEWVGEMFDGIGLVRALRGYRPCVRDSRVLLLGAGGAGRAIAMSLADAGVSGLDLFDIKVDRANELVDRVQRFYPPCRAQVVRPEASGHDLVINATPVGMAVDDELPAPIGKLDAGTIVFDIVPKPAVTRLMAYAKEAGCQVIGGASMIEAQADAILEFLALGTANGHE